MLSATGPSAHTLHKLHPIENHPLEPEVLPQPIPLRPCFFSVPPLLLETPRTGNFIQGCPLFFPKPPGVQRNAGCPGDPLHLVVGGDRGNHTDRRGESHVRHDAGECVLGGRGRLDGVLKGRQRRRQAVGGERSSTKHADGKESLLQELLANVCLCHVACFDDAQGRIEVPRLDGAVQRRLGRVRLDRLVCPLGVLRLILNGAVDDSGLRLGRENLEDLGECFRPAESCLDSHV